MIFTKKRNFSLLFKNSHRAFSLCQMLLFVFIALMADAAYAKTGSFFSNFSSTPQIGNFGLPLVETNKKVGADTIFAVGNLGQINAIPNGAYSITAKHSGKALDVSNSSLDNGATVNQWDYVNGNNQKWLVESIGDGTYRLTAANSGKALDVSDASLQNGAVVHQWSYVGGDNQKWRIESVGNGYYRIIAKHSGKALDVSGASYNNGAGIIQWDYTGGDNQQWQFNLVGQGSQSPFVPAHYQLIFNDEFGQEELNTSKWFTRYIYADGYQDYLNDEQERYRENGNHVMSGSSLKLTAKYDQTDHYYTSGMIRSKTTFKYGYFEGRFKLPKGRGIWPAFWLNSDGNTDSELTWPPEVDIFEYVVNDTYEHPNMIHTGVINHGPQGNTVLARDPAYNTQWGYYLAPSDLSDDWHVIALLWDTDDTVTTYIDGRMIVKRSTRWVKQNGENAPNAHVLVNFAFGGSWAGPIDDTQLPSFLDVDYIRVYQKVKLKNTGTAVIGHDLCPVRGC